MSKRLERFLAALKNDEEIASIWAMAKPYLGMAKLFGINVEVAVQNIDHEQVERLMDKIVDEWRNSDTERFEEPASA